MGKKLLTKLRQIVCAIFRHSNIEESCFGYIHCARCEALKGDTLAGAYKNPFVVGLECACEVCEANVGKLTFADTFLTPKPKWIGRAAEYRREKDEQKRQFREFMDNYKASV